MIDSMSIPVSYIVWTCRQMREVLQCPLLMRGSTHDIFKWWTTEAVTV